VTSRAASTSTLTESSRAELAVELRGGRSVVTSLHGSSPLALRPLPGREGAARVALAQSSATLLNGDQVTLNVRVGAGARLELEEISATLAHPTPSGDPGMVQRVEIEIGPGATALVDEQPLIIADSARLDRTVCVSLHEDARCLHREVVVLGRYGELAGPSRLRRRVERDGLPVLDETLETSSAVIASAAVAAGARVLASVGCFGQALPSGLTSRPGTFVLGERDTLHRSLGGDAPSALAASEWAWSLWRQAMTAGVL